MIKAADSVGLMPLRLWVATMLAQGILPSRVGGYTLTDRKRIVAESLAMADELLAQANGARLKEEGE